ncbi:hypothetical protein EZJ19_03325 [Parasulfuritortus cantonensis]|uniref:Uncharacterized protein n=1 Tax=Parasulfuritortus cantonensis TaxID=2528202 RepID=A0A4R1BKS3_9PROT|nr:hypothetical protein [Parasulfuritortus cantonensis]TCJ17953.1 hypothetical protein EZJ19_03325 [Parasulfuritortus cantonensis]
MVNEMTVIGSASVARDYGLATASQGPVVTANGSALPGGSGVSLSAGTFSGLASAKDATADVAVSVREVGKALEQVGVLLGQLDQQVGQVKNYPPFPPGNEQRAAYINSLNGLRRQMEAVSVPPVDNGSEPVFYPKETELPVLDAGAATDGEVAALGNQAADVRAQVDRLLGDLHTRFADQLPGQMAQGGGETEVLALVSSVGRQLAAAPQAMTQAGTAAVAGL